MSYPKHIIDTFPACVNMFTAQEVHDYKGVLLVSPESQSDNSIIHFYYGSQGGGCSGGCDLQQITKTDDAWELRVPKNPNDPDGDTQQISVDYCLAAPVAEACTFNLNRNLLIVVVVFNLVKFVSFVLILWVCDTPMVAVGDAAASFLEDGDPTTEHAGPVSARDIRRSNSKRTTNNRNSYLRTLAIGGRPYEIVDTRWFHAASLSLWIATILT